MKHKFAVIILVATFFGLSGGVVGAIVARVYIWEKALNIPLFGELDFTEDPTGSSVVIRNPRKVVVDQDLKVAETAESLKNNIVDIFPAIASGTAAAPFDPGDYYGPDNRLASGFIITSDGWLISSYVPDSLLKYEKQTLTAAEAEARAKLVSSFVVLNAGKQVKVVDRIVVGDRHKYAYYHIEANDLPVKKLLAHNEYKAGESVLVLNSRNWVLLTNILGEAVAGGTVRSSDSYASTLYLSDDLPEDFFGTFVFNMNGDLVALIDSGGDVEPVSNYNSCITCILKNGVISRPFLGLYYVELADLTKAGAPAGAAAQYGAVIYNDKGVAVVPGSPAAKAGLAAGDVILAVDGQKVNLDNDLAWQISRHFPGDELSLTVLSGGAEKEVKVLLAETVEK